MNKDELYKAFLELFPHWEGEVEKYKKIGSKALQIRTRFRSYVFLYYDEKNWQFGTKLWRKRPAHLLKPRPPKKKGASK